MTIRVLFFGRLKDYIGKDTLFFDSIEDTESLRKTLVDRFPRLRREIFSIALNQEIVHGNEKLSDGDEIALLPPVAGG
jgi:molybdopterin converting factor subunit 1